MRASSHRRDSLDVLGVVQGKSGNNARIVILIVIEMLQIAKPTPPARFVHRQQQRCQLDAVGFSRLPAQLQAIVLLICVELHALPSRLPPENAMFFVLPGK